MTDAGRCGRGGGGKLLARNGRARWRNAWRRSRDRGMERVGWGKRDMEGDTGRALVGFGMAHAPQLLANGRS